MCGLWHIFHAYHVTTQPQHFLSSKVIGRQMYVFFVEAICLIVHFFFFLCYSHELSGSTCINVVVTVVQNSCQASVHDSWPFMEVKVWNFWMTLLTSTLFIANVSCLLHWPCARTCPCLRIIWMLISKKKKSKIYEHFWCAQVAGKFWLGPGDTLLGWHPNPMAAIRVSADVLRFSRVSMCPVSGCSLRKTKQKHKNTSRLCPGLICELRTWDPGIRVRLHLSSVSRAERSGIFEHTSPNHFLFLLWQFF